MFGNLFKSRPEKQTAETLYRGIVTAARQPVLYQDGGVDDTIEGRLELVMLHAALVILVLRDSEEERAREVSQQLFDTMFDDFDAAMRELGVGDSALGKKIRHIAKGFYGRAQTYGEALDTEDAAALADDLARNVFASEAVDERAERLSVYVNAALSALREQGAQALVDGADPAFPDARAALSSLA